MIVEFLPQARSELHDAVSYYEGEMSGLGLRFWGELDQHIVWITENPEVPRLRPGGYRRVNLKIFPYYISYIVFLHCSRSGDLDPSRRSWPYAPRVLDR